MAADFIDGVIVAVAATVIGSVIVNKFFNGQPAGGGNPRQLRGENSPTVRGGAVQIYTPDRAPAYAAPVVQNTPITEAAYNIQPTEYEPTLGPARHRPPQEALLPI